MGLPAHRPHHGKETIVLAYVSFTKKSVVTYSVEVDSLEEAEKLGKELAGSDWLPEVGAPALEAADTDYGFERAWEIPAWLGYQPEWVAYDKAGVARLADEYDLSL